MKRPTDADNHRKRMNRRPTGRRYSFSPTTAIYNRAATEISVLPRAETLFARAWGRQPQQAKTTRFPEWKTGGFVSLGTSLPCLQGYYSGINNHYPHISPSMVLILKRKSVLSSNESQYLPFSLGIPGSYPDAIVKPAPRDRSSKM